MEKVNKRYKNEKIICFSIEIKSKELNIYKKCTHVWLKRKKANKNITL